MRLIATLVIVAVLLTGCARDGEVAPVGDTGGSQPLAGAGGGAGSMMGTGGALGAAGTIGTTFTRDDHDLCEAWPDCPPNVIAPWTTEQAWVVRPTACQAALTAASGPGVVIRCGGCINRDTCAPFVGRCRARYWTTMPKSGDSTPWTPWIWTADQCREWEATPGIAQWPDGWAICTGYTFWSRPDGTTSAGDVCRD